MTDQLTKLVKKMFNNQASVSAAEGGRLTIDTREPTITISDLAELRRNGFTPVTVTSDDGYILVTGRLA